MTRNKPPKKDKSKEIRFTDAPINDEPIDKQVQTVDMEINENVGRYSLAIGQPRYYILTEETSRNCKHLYRSTHCHQNFFELVYVLQGTGVYIHGDDSYFLKKGDLFIANPGIKHRISSFQTMDLSMLWFHFQIHDSYVSTTNQYEDQLIQNFLKNHHIVQKDQLFLSHYFSLLSSSTPDFNSRAYGIKQAIRNFILESLASLCSDPPTFEDSKIVSNSILKKSLDFIEHNLHNKIYVSQLAAEVNTSERNLRHLFKKHLHSSVIAEINRRKMNYACHLLSMGLNNKEISDYLKFSDPFQFSKLFKKYHQLSPKQYQLKCCGQQQMAYTDFFQD